MKKTLLTLFCLAVLALRISAQKPVDNPTPDFKVIVNTDREPVHEGEFEPTVESLSTYECPEWFRDAKFGIWAHWGPQCAPEAGDWYGRGMYDENNWQYQYQLDTKGHPSEFGFKDWIPEFTADNWDPDALVRLYKESGARYFMTLANHHDNFDLYESRYQKWNSVEMGPRKDIVGGWAEACRKYGLRFAVSVHASHAWSWYETSRGADTKGAFKGVPYDGWTTKEDGVGKWWEGYDPQELYAQDHPLGKGLDWDWDENIVVTPSQEYCDKFYNRTMQLINTYSPDMVYFDDTYLPLWPVSDAGLKLAAHMYNKSMAENGGVNQSVITGKVLNDWMKNTIIWDVERGAPDKMQEKPWQTCTCIGEWHYNKRIYYEGRYKTVDQVVTMLVDIVSKNGNLLLSIPLRKDGTPDEQELAIVRGIGEWMNINGESIYGTRPWKIYGEGPVAEASNPINAQGFNEGQTKYTGADLRFNQKGDKVLYVTVMATPEDDITVRSLGSRTEFNSKKIKSISLLGSDETVAWSQTSDHLSIARPDRLPSESAIVYKVTFR